MRIQVSQSSDKDDLAQLVGEGATFNTQANVIGGVEYSFILPKLPLIGLTKLANEATERMTAKFGSRRVAATYLTTHAGKSVFVVILGTNLTVIK